MELDGGVAGARLRPCGAVGMLALSKGLGDVVSNTASMLMVMTPSDGGQSMEDEVVIIAHGSDGLPHPTFQPILRA